VWVTFFEVVADVVIAGSFVGLFIRGRRQKNVNSGADYMGSPEPIPNDKRP
jgi:hypothetical protein